MSERAKRRAEAQRIANEEMARPSFMSTEQATALKELKKNTSFDGQDYYLKHDGQNHKRLRTISETPYIVPSGHRISTVEIFADHVMVGFANGDTRKLPMDFFPGCEIPEIILPEKGGIALVFDNMRIDCETVWNTEEK